LLISLKKQKENIVNMEEPQCPRCFTPGQRVMLQTVKGLCPHSQINEEDHYFLCLSPDCAAGYFSTKGELIYKDALSVPIWFKEKSPVPVCYCQDVTDEEIWKHVAIYGCCNSLEDIQSHTGANTGCQCNIKSPAAR
jgi:bacterioferritin-associated ferredoxin